ncbi:MAG: adenine phosphoribosyltransferase [Pikeienuella sp.]
MTDARLSNDPSAAERPLRSYIRTIPDFPVPGVQFRDVTTLFNDAEAFKRTVEALIAPHRGRQIEVIAAMDARGFILGGAIAYALVRPFVPIRKKGKLPGATFMEAYSLEYGEAIVEIHDDAFAAGTKVLLVDDLIATGGTAAAGVKLIEKLGGDLVAASFVVDLPDLGGRQRLEAMGVETHALMAFEGD